MMKLKVQNLADVFGWMHVRARDVADSLGNRIASAMNIALVIQAVGKINSIRGPFEMAANAWTFVKPTTSGRPFKPFVLSPLLSREPR